MKIIEIAIYIYIYITFSSEFLLCKIKSSLWWSKFFQAGKTNTVIEAHV